MIVRKLEMKQGLTDEQIQSFENTLVEWKIHQRSCFQGDDNYFVVGFENEIDLLAFMVANGDVVVEEVE